MSRVEESSRVEFMMNEIPDPRPYKAQVEVTFPTPTQAKHAMDVLSVDGELGDKVIKTFAIVPSTESGDGSGVIMRVSVEATEAKMLRVSLSSFYDLLRVVLRCYQEFQ